MDFVINENELAALCGSPHMQQLVYIRGIRPYMDVKTGIVGIKRGISLQSIAEQLYVEPHQGIKSVSYSRAQVKRALSGLERAGVITLQSQKLKLILKCELATRNFSVQNKAVTNPSQKVVTTTYQQDAEIANDSLITTQKTDTVKTAKAVPPLIKDNYIYFLLPQFERFWACYPEKKSKSSAWQAFQQLNPEPALFDKILQALEAQINHRAAMHAHGAWVPPWKYPANWLIQHCWEDEITMETSKESKHANNQANTGKQPAKDMFCPPSDSEEQAITTNVVQFHRHR